MSAKPTLAVVGATGAVGTIMLDLLSTRQDVWGEIRLIASPRSAGRTLQVRGTEVEIISMFTPASASAPKKVAVTPGWERMPAPISETLPMRSS